MTLPAVVPTEPVTEIRSAVIEAMAVVVRAWYHDADPDYAELDRVLREALAQAAAEHEATLKERGWKDEYEVETAAAMNYGEGAAYMKWRIRHEFRDLPLIVAAIDGMGET